MECLRCAGLMISEQFYDFLDDKGNDFIGYRCLVCGEIMDPIIAKNKKGGLKTVVGVHGLLTAQPKNKMNHLMLTNNI